jgi:pimeloyl-ACP methyl ester carboxylesterase
MRTMTSNGVALEYETRGVGEPVALIHLSLYADSFAPLMDQPALAGYQLLRYHRRGYAGSARTAGPVTIADQAADLAGLLGCLGIRRAHVAGHSYGGLIALQLAWIDLTWWAQSCSWSPRCACDPADQPAKI